MISSVLDATGVAFSWIDVYSQGSADAHCTCCVSMTTFLLQRTTISACIVGCAVLRTMLYVIWSSNRANHLVATCPGCEGILQGHPPARAGPRESIGVGYFGFSWDGILSRKRAKELARNEKWRSSAIGQRTESPRKRPITELPHFLLTCKFHFSFRW